MEQQYFSKDLLIGQFLKLIDSQSNAQNAVLNVDHFKISFEETNPK